MQQNILLITDDSGQTVSNERESDLRSRCGCTAAGWRQLSTGSPAGTLASLLSRNAPSQPLAGKTGNPKDALIIFKVFSRWFADAEPNGAFVELYLFGGVGRIGEDGLPVGPHKHDEGEVEEGQVDDWRKTSNRTTWTSWFQEMLILLKVFRGSRTSIINEREANTTADWGHADRLAN